jgi:omega-amidase
MRCASAQLTSCWGDPAATLQKAEAWIARASGKGAALIVFPEQFATGWDPADGRWTQDMGGEIVTALRDSARNHGIAIVGSFREAHTPLPRNTAVAIGPDGRVLAAYAKMHLFSHSGEDRHFSPGDGLALFELSGVRFGLAICYDLRFAPLFAAYAAAGADAILLPSAWPAARARHFSLFIQARAAECQCYVTGVNTTGTDPVDRYAGGSLTADPHGTVVAQAGEEEEILCQEIDPSVVRQARSAFPVSRDRREDLYRRILQK